MTLNEVGDAWKTIYQSRHLSWFHPGKIDPSYLLRFARSEWITRILRHARLKPGQGVKLLEAGCGTGMYAIGFALLGFQ